MDDPWSSSTIVPSKNKSKTQIVRHSVLGWYSLCFDGFQILSCSDKRKYNELADSREVIMPNTDIRTVQQNISMGVTGNN